MKSITVSEEYGEPLNLRRFKKKKKRKFVKRQGHRISWLCIPTRRLVMYMKRYLLFVGIDYYPCGGWGDFEGSFHTIEEAREQINREWGEWYEIVDTEAPNLKEAVVAKGEIHYYGDRQYGKIVDTNLCHFPTHGKE